MQNGGGGAGCMTVPKGVSAQRDVGILNLDEDRGTTLHSTHMKKSNRPTLTVTCNVVHKQRTNTCRGRHLCACEPGACEVALQLPTGVRAINHNQVVFSRLGVEKRERQLQASITKGGLGSEGLCVSILSRKNTNDPTLINHCGSRKRNPKNFHFGQKYRI